METFCNGLSSPSHVLPPVLSVSALMVAASFYSFGRKPGREHSDGAAVSSLFTLGYAAILLTTGKHKESGSLIYIESKTSDSNDKKFQAPRNSPLCLHDAR